MPQLIRPTTKVTVVPRDGELEITLNIHITVDGEVVATAEGGSVKSVKTFSKDDDDKVPHIMPDFGSGFKLNFGKKENC